MKAEVEATPTPRKVIFHEDCGEWHVSPGRDMLPVGIKVELKLDTYRIANSDNTVREEINVTVHWSHQRAERCVWSASAKAAREMMGNILDAREHTSICAARIGPSSRVMRYGFITYAPSLTF